MKYDLLIKNGTVVDGTGSKRKDLDLGVRDGVVEAMGDLKEHEDQAELVIDARGKIVAPGFIDIMSHVDNFWSIFDYPGGESFLSQGITTVIGGNCGSSLAPVVSNDSMLAIQKWTDVKKVSVQWNSVAEFLRFLEDVHLPVNFGTLVGHSTLRRGFLADEVRGLKPSELESLLHLLEQALQEGAYGFSTGLGYAHAEFAPEEELEAFCKVVAAHNGLYATHVRDEGAGLVPAIQEAIDTAKASGVRLEISHLKSKGRENWNDIDAALQKLKKARDEGVDVAFDLHPYSTTMSVMYAYLPGWSYEGGIGTLLENIRGKRTRRKIIEGMKKDPHDYGKLVAAKVDGLSTMAGKTFEQIAVTQETSVEDAVLDAIESSRGRFLVFDDSLKPETVERLIFDEMSMISTDDGYYDTEKVKKLNELAHPRAYGCFPKFLELARFTGEYSLEKAVQKITLKPAERLGLPFRGQLAEHKIADVVIFDEKNIGSQATFLNPFQLSTGVEVVVVAGKVAYENGRFTNAGAGRVLRRVES